MAQSTRKPTSAVWRERLTQVGWVVLPLRLFLGLTMVYAGLLKFFDPAYLDPSSPNGVQKQMEAAASSSPIGFIVSFSAQHATLFGLTIALGELLVGLGVLLGLWTRIAAIGGFLLSLSFFLTVSWGTSPYFFGPDIVFMFAFTPLILGGDGGLYSLGAGIRNGTRRSMRLETPAPAHESPKVAAEVDRRVLLRTGVTAAAIGAGALVLGGVGRMVAGTGGTSTAVADVGTAPSVDPNSSSTPAPLGNGPSAAPAASQPASSGKPRGGVKIGKASDLAVGGVAAFTNPKTNEPSYVLQPKAGTYLAYSGVCTHQGCTVGYDQPSNQFACPCHGARFDASNGDVVRGPARRPLAKLDVVQSNGNLYLV
jgi:thiosulfate dehydrogenase [quinone] large subunit